MFCMCMYVSCRICSEVNGVFKARVEAYSSLGPERNHDKCHNMIKTYTVAALNQFILLVEPFMKQLVQSYASTKRLHTVHTTRSQNVTKPLNLDHHFLKSMWLLLYQTWLLSFCPGLKPITPEASFSSWMEALGQASYPAQWKLF